jgi:hypothetical protein
MRVLLILTLLSGCANLQDNTTVGDKAVIGGFFAIMVIGMKGIGI